MFFSTIYSCLGSHFALNHIYGLERKVGDKKIFGVYEHEILRYSTHPILQRVDDVINAPHSRWGDVSIDEMKKADIEVLAKSDKAGWLIASCNNESNGFDIFLQGHPEYDKYDLHSEFIRDWQNGQAMPKDYYDSNNPASMPIMTWSNDARALHSNWIAAMYKHFSGN
ncbi:MAG: homoserine O-succinyltransferase [Acidimicrobiia bacterium]